MTVTYTILTPEPGELLAAETTDGVFFISFGPDGFKELSDYVRRWRPGEQIIPSILDCNGQLEEYLAGRRREFDLPLDLQGTDFQKEVWRAIARIPYGQTKSYQDLAREIGRPNAARAVGAACGANPVPLVVPCHRVLGSGGGLTGFGGGLPWKKWLLDLERAAA